MSKPEPNEDVKKLAERMVSFEKHEKGAIGKLFAFEARDGFWSKLVKTLGPVASALVGGSMAFTAASALVSGPAGLAVAGAVAVAGGLASGAINRAVNESIFSDLHDSHKDGLGKFGHYLGIGLAGVVANIAVNAVLPGLSTVAASVASIASMGVINPLVEVFASKGIASGLGDQQLRKESAEAREIARQAIQSGQSVEQVLGHGKSAEHASHHAAPENHGHATEKTREFVKMVEEQRANAQHLSIA